MSESGTRDATARARFYLDEDVPHGAAAIGIALGLEVVAARDVFVAGRPHAGVLVLTRKLPRDPARIAHALVRWVEQRLENGWWPMQSYEIDFLSG